MLGGGGEQAPAAGHGPTEGAGADGVDEADGAQEAELIEDRPSGTATVTLDGVFIEDVMDVGDLVELLDGAQTLLDPELRSPSPGWRCCTR